MHGNSILIMQFFRRRASLFWRRIFGVSEATCRNLCELHVPVLLQKWQNPLTMHYFSALCTTLTILFTTSFVQGVSLCIILDNGHHDRQLTVVSGRLRKRNFTHRMLFKDCYWLCHIRRLRYVIQWLLSVSINFYHCCFNRFVLCRCVLSFCHY